MVSTCPKWNLPIFSKPGSLQSSISVNDSSTHSSFKFFLQTATYICPLVTINSATTTPYLECFSSFLTHLLTLFLGPWSPFSSQQTEKSIKKKKKKKHVSQSKSEVTPLAQNLSKFPRCSLKMTLDHEGPIPAPAPFLSLISSLPHYTHSDLLVQPSA